MGMYVCIHACVRACVRAYMHACMHARMHAGGRAGGQAGRQAGKSIIAFRMTNISQIYVRISVSHVYLCWERVHICMLKVDLLSPLFWGEITIYI